MGEDNDSTNVGAANNHAPFPVWLTQLVYFGGVIVALAAFQFSQSGDLRSVREETARIAGDVNAIRQSIPNKEVYDMKLTDLAKEIDKVSNTRENEIKQLTDDLKVEVMMGQKLRERLLAKHIID